MARKNADGWAAGDTCLTPSGKTGVIEEVGKRDVFVRVLIDIHVGGDTFKDAGYNSFWLDNDQVRRPEAHQ